MHRFLFWLNSDNNNGHSLWTFIPLKVKPFRPETSATNQPVTRHHNPDSRRLNYTAAKV